MNRSDRPKPRTAEAAITSDAELAQFLRRLSDLYSDRQTGNQPLAAALKRLSMKLASEAPNQSARGRAEQSRSLFDEKPADITDLSLSDIVELLARDCSKAELVRVATVRFSIPKSRLLKMGVDGIRETIRSAVAHEESLTALTEEALRQGSRRQS